MHYVVHRVNPANVGSEHIPSWNPAWDQSHDQKCQACMLDCWILWQNAADGINLYFIIKAKTYNERELGIKNLIWQKEYIIKVKVK